MKRTLVLLILTLFLTPIFASYGIDRDIGMLCDIEQNSNESRVLEFFFAEFSLSSLESFVVPSFQKSFSMQYGERLAKILPLNEALLSLKDGTLTIKDRTKSVIIDVFYDNSGLITSINIR